MGVTGLWQLVGPVGKPVTLESLENKVLAVDVSIWLNQALKGIRDGHGQSVPNAHLQSLCYRICKLLFYKIKPVFVFDGTAPLLKKQTLAAREHQRQTSACNVSRTAHRILTNLLATEAVQSGSKTKSPKKNKTLAPRSEDDIYCLPSLEGEGNRMHLEENEEEEEDDIDDVQALGHASLEHRYQDLSSVDTSSYQFRSLPPDVRYELLSTKKTQMRQQHHYSLPADSEDFSRFQMRNLLERSRLQRDMDVAAKELSRQQVGDVMQELFQDGEAGTHRIVSEDSAYSILIKTTQKPPEDPLTESTSKISILEDLDEFIITSSSDDDEELRLAKRESLRVHKALTTDSKEVQVVDISEEYDTNAMKKSKNIDISVPEDRLKISVPSTSKYNEGWNDASKKSANTNAVSDWLDEVKQKNDTPELLANEASLNIEVVDNSEITPVFETTKIYPKDSPIVVIPVSRKCETIQEKNIKDSVNLVKPSKVVCDLESEVVSSQKSQSSDLIRTVLNSETSKGPVSLEGGSKDKIVVGTNGMLFESAEGSVSISNNPQLMKDSSVECSECEIPVLMESKNVTFQLKSGADLVEDELFPVDIFQTNISQESSEEKIEELVEEKILNPPETRSDEDEIEVLLPKELLNAPNQEVALSVLEAERETLLKERGRQERQAQTLSQQILAESKDLLRLFGVPFMVSPTEAEAQCATLESLHLTQGTITDDSDIWLFGGDHVYRHFFHQDKYVQLYTSKQIKTHYGLDRDLLICFAMLTGSDYTEGVEGVGPVTAMEVLAEFKGQGLQSLSTLKSWWSKHRKQKLPPGNPVRSKLTSLHLSESFPREDVYQAYQQPSVDNCKEKFSWQPPDLCALRELLNEKLGWRMEKINNLLLPVMKKVNEHQSQTRLDSFFTVSLKPEAVLPPSKRLQRALQKVHPSSSSDNKEASAIRGRGENSNKGDRSCLKVTNPRKHGGDGRKRTTRSVQLSDSDPDDPLPIVKNAAPPYTLSLSDSGSIKQIPALKRRKNKR